MMRLLWKEAREQAWFVLAALAAPLATALYWGWYVDHPEWPSYQYQLLLVHGVFALWGARLMPVERERGRITLGTLPVPGWQVWLAKVLPALLMVYPVAAFTFELHTNGPLRWLLPVPYMAGAYAACFGAGFLLGMALNTPAAALFTVVVVPFGTLTLVRWAHISGWMVESRALWPLAAILLLVSFGILALRGGVPSPARARWPVALTALLLALPRAPWFFGGLFPSSSPPYPYGASAAFSNSRWVAFAAASYDHLWVAPADGGLGRTVDDGGWILPVGWIRTGELVYRKATPVASGPSPDEYLLAWSPATHATREVLRIPQKRVGCAGGWLTYAAEPNGRRIAYFLRPETPLFTIANDVWVADAVTGKAHLAAPWVWGDTLLWRGGRIYIRSRDALWSVSPEGGPVRPETYLPPEDAGAALQRGEARR